MRKIKKLMKKLNYFIHNTSIIDQNVKIGSGTKIWHWCHVSKNAKIGKNCKLGQNVFIGEGVIIGDNVKIQNNVSVYSGVICEDNVFLGPSMVFTNVINPRSEINRRDKYQKTFVKYGSTIGANATIVCGVTIGEYSLVGAGSVITKDVLPYSLVVGNPGKQIGWVSEFGITLKFNDKMIAVCPESNQIYKRVNDHKIIKIKGKK